MTTIKASCPGCGEVGLAPSCIILVVGDDASYSFTCPGCSAHIRKPAPKRVIRLLMSGGVTVREPAAPKGSGRPITYDDIHAFHDGFSNPDWHRELEGNR